MTAQARYDKTGRQLADTGHGCGCRQCEDAGAPRYERREIATRSGGRWSAWRRAVVVRMLRGLAPFRRRIEPA